MPKLNMTQLIARIEQRISDLENGVAFEARDINSLLNEQQRSELKDAWTQQQQLRKTHKPPKTAEAVKAIGWKTIREVRLEIYQKALAHAKGSVLDDLKSELTRKDTRKAKVFLDAYFDAKDRGKNAESAGNIAVTRAGLSARRSLRTRDDEVNRLEQAILSKNSDEEN